jgi:hypothetical protein
VILKSFTVFTWTIWFYQNEHERLISLRIISCLILAHSQVKHRHVFPDHWTILQKCCYDTRHNIHFVDIKKSSRLKLYFQGDDCVDNNFFVVTTSSKLDNHHRIVSNYSVNVANWLLLYPHEIVQRSEVPRTPCLRPKTLE